MPDADDHKFLRDNLEGKLVLPGDGESFDAAREIWNHRLRRKPAAVACCASAEDVARCVRYASESGLPLRVKSGGHSYAGLGTGEGALVVNLSEMNRIAIDAEARRATVGPGVRLGALYEAAIAEGLAFPGGTVTTVGVAGLTLGGGSGWLSRKYGLAVDNLLGAEVVTADGRILETSESREPGLFWALRGGGGNFGIVTRFDLRLHEVPSEVVFGHLFFALEDAKTVLRQFRDHFPETPREFCTFPAMLRIPPIPDFPEKLHGQVVLILILGHTGDPEEGMAIAGEMARFAKPLLNTVGRQPYMAMQSAFDAGVPSGQRWYSRSHYVPELSDEAIAVFIKNASVMKGSLTFAYFGLDNGAMIQREIQATAYPHRESAWAFHILAGWTDPAEDVAVKGWVRAFHQEMEPFAFGRIYVNLLAEDEPHRVDDAYGGNYQLLAALKQAWDPDNLFRGNHNIPPGLPR